MLACLNTLQKDIVAVQYMYVYGSIYIIAECLTTGASDVPGAKYKAKAWQQLA